MNGKDNMFTKTAVQVGVAIVVICLLGALVTLICFTKDCTVHCVPEPGSQFKCPSVNTPYKIPGGP
jgi:hypothetical protein